MTARYAVYFAPSEDSDLWRFGSGWIGRDAVTGAETGASAPVGLDSGRWQEITASPRHYGFHATLKPPFALAEGTDEGGLARAAAAFAATYPPFESPPLVVTDLGGFLALCPSTPSPQLNRLAADCVRAFDAFRARQSAAELDKRRKGGLPLRQEAMLQRWGYPYVMDEFRFHMTLTVRLEPGERESVAALLAPLAAPLAAQALAVDGICLYRQPHREAPFTLLRRFGFGG